MEILEILKNSKDEIYLEDLDFFETELETGDYSKRYIFECKKEIKLLRKWLSGEDEVTQSHCEEVAQSKKQSKNSLFMGFYNVSPKITDPVVEKKHMKDIIFSDIKTMRESDSYKSKFKKYIQDTVEIDEMFIDTHYSFFEQWELDTILTIKQLDENFLEKYFEALDKNKISRYQLFSESFFMKHYTQLDNKIVLTKGKNEWRKKENRSKQLDVFLRLKGVKL